ncbi:tetracycline resistance transcriptional repressor TetR [Achromobacter aegrifaciens]
MTKLRLDVVIRAGLDLLNEVGVDGLTTRKLAERLGVQQPALYWHFKNKRALLDRLAEAMLSENHTYSMPRPGDGWRAFLNGNARSFRRALLAYRDGARIHAGTRPSEPQFETVEAQLSFLCKEGFAPGDAAHALVAVSCYTVGAVLEQQAAETDGHDRRAGQPASPSPATPFLAAALQAFDDAGPDAAFEYGLALLVDGLEKKRDPSSPSGALIQK